MKAIVLSDSHRDFSSILRAMEKESNIDYIIHAGDVHRDVEDIQAMWQNIPCIYVVGNNDFSVWDVPTRREFILEGKRFLLTHGHLYGVKSSLARLHREAADCQADICIFGHTHKAHLEEKNGIRFLNPGAAYRSYAVIEIHGATIDIQLKEN
ncbi:MAG: metallophosphoesterase [Clostridia bacterium]|nr:metallophosphoesterase [Clostridia bacterium]